MTKAGTIILLAAGRSSRFPGMRPKWMLAAPSGELMLQMALRSIPCWQDHRLVIGALEQHLDELGGRTAIRRALGDAAEIVAFPEVTTGPAATVAAVVRQAEVAGPIFVKDCDSWFTTGDALFDNAVCVGDLRTMPRVRNVAAKSFVTLREDGTVAGIHEKSVASNYVSLGGYGFRDAGQFLNAFEAGEAAQAGEHFISGVIQRLVLDGVAFAGLLCRDYQDVGTLESWGAFKRERMAYFVDLDGVVFQNAGEFLPPFWEDPDKPLARNVQALAELSARGAQLIFVTARPERFREKTEAALRSAGLTWHAIVFGVHHSGRVLVNDFSPTNAYPSAIAINSRRNSDDLETLLPMELSR